MLPSSNCTMLWIILCGWITTCICSGCRLKSHLASIISSPLFMSVAESMVIFAPMAQLGCCSYAWSRFTFTKSWVFTQEGPAAGSKNYFSILLRPSPTRHWNMAECSLSRNNGVRFSTAFCITKSPATTKVSLLAKPTGLPFSTALKVGFKPAKPKCLPASYHSCQSQLLLPVPLHLQNFCIGKLMHLLLLVFIFIPNYNGIGFKFYCPVLPVIHRWFEL